MKLGIIGLPNVGKSALFNAMTKLNAESKNYPFCTINPNIGISNIYDIRLKFLKIFYNSNKIIYEKITFIDIAGLIKGASNGNGLGNKFLSYIKEVDAIIHVVRCFNDNNIININNDNDNIKINPLYDIKIINSELIYSDLNIINKNIKKISKLNNIKKYILEINFLKILKKHLQNGNFISILKINNKYKKKIIKKYNFLTSKPIIYIANISVDNLLNFSLTTKIYIKKIIKYTKNISNTIVYPLCIKIEEKISKLNNFDKKEFLKKNKIKNYKLNNFIINSYKVLGFIIFFTVGKDEIKAWMIKKGTKAKKAAGKIHSDFKKGFIKAEVINYKNLYNYKLYNNKKKIFIHMEGKKYIVKDGDIITFYFNV